MRFKAVSFLCMCGAGAGCAIGIPIGRSVAPKKVERLAWKDFSGRWTDTLAEVTEEVYKIPELQKIKAERIKLLEQHSKSSPEASEELEMMKNPRLYFQKKASELKDLKNDGYGNEIPEEIRAAIIAETEAISWEAPKG